MKIKLVSQKKFPRFLTLFFISVFIFQMILILILLFLPSESQAIDKPTLQVPIGEFDGSKFSSVSASDGKISIPWIGEYIRAIYNYAISIVGILAAVVLMWGGVRWITAGGNAEAVGEAKKWITSSLSGLVLVMCSYMILYTVNPDLTQFRPIEVEVVKAPPTTGCCEYGPDCANNITEDMCGIRTGFVTWAPNATCNQNNKCADIISQQINDPQCTQKGGTGSIYVNKNDTQASNDCAQKCNPRTVNYSLSSWYGTNGNYNYCCVCSICDGSNDGVECASQKTCQGGICLSCETEGDWCDPGDCCAGLTCDESLTPDRCVSI